MAPYEKRLQTDMQKIEELLISIEKQVRKALLTNNHTLAYNVILEDKAINRLEAQLKEKCFSFIVKHLPAAGHLRFVSSIMEMGSELERMGDYAVTICRETVQLSNLPDSSIKNDIEKIASESFQALNQAMCAFVNKDSNLSKETFKLTRIVPNSFDTIYEKMCSSDTFKSWKRNDLFAYLVIFNMFLRVADRTENICEEIRFLISGKLKKSKKYGVLFLDENNSYLAPIAKGICDKFFIDKGHFAIASKRPVKEIDTSLIEFMKSSETPYYHEEPVDYMTIDPSEYYIIVSLQGSISSFLKKIPFHSIALEWDLDNLIEDNTKNLNKEKLEIIYREISSRIHDLMEKLYGLEG